jgi:hypothetical protein
LSAKLWSCISAHLAQPLQPDRPLSNCAGGCRGIGPSGVGVMPSAIRIGATKPIGPNNQRFELSFKHSGLGDSLF